MDQASSETGTIVMAVSLPDYGFSALDIPPEMGINSARTEGGLIVTSRHIDPFFAGTITTGPLSQDEHADMCAFLVDCVDMNRRIDFIHPRHKVPRAYTLENLPFAGTGTVEEVVDLRTIRLSRLPLGLILKRGDRLTLEQGNMLCCRWVQADLVVANSLSQNISLTPRLPFGVFAPGSTARFKNAALRMTVVPKSFSMAEAYGPTPISFDVSEALL